MLSAGVGSGPLVPSSVTATSLRRSRTPSGTGSSTWTVTVSTTLDPATGGVRSAPPGSEAMSHVTVLASVVQPLSHDTKVVPVGSRSVTTTPEASWSPLFRTVSV